MIISLIAKHKVGFIDGTIPIPNPESPQFIVDSMQYDCFELDHQLCFTWNWF